MMTRDEPSQRHRQQERYEQAGQAQVFAYFDSLNSQEQQSLLEQLASVEVEKIADLLRLAQDGGKESEKSVVIEPFAGDKVGSLSDSNKSVEPYWQKGLEAIARGQVAALVLAGGQGTRLGFDGPKGMYNVGLPSQKSLFQLMAERLSKLKQLAATASEKSSANDGCSLPFYIMTSPINHEATQTFFEQQNYFGMGKENVILFQQGMLPCLTAEGKIIMETASSMAMAPDGNGGIYPSLLKSGALQDMQQRGVHYIHVFSIDNALVKPADPYFIGFCMDKQADCGNKSTRKSHPHEKVGVVALRNGKPCVVEYSEISQSMAEEVDGEGKLKFAASNICQHFFTVDFLQNMVLPNIGNLYHVANKKIPYFDEKQATTVKPESNNGIKLETFIFDVFSLSKQFAVWEVDRSEEFAPVKNAPGSPSDSPDTARAMISNLCQTWLKEAGATVQSSSEAADAICEISPLLSYAGEGLEKYKDQTIELPCHLSPSK